MQFFNVDILISGCIVHVLILYALWSVYIHVAK